jgi:hypothetical protein
MMLLFPLKVSVSLAISAVLLSSLETLEEKNRLLFFT